MDPASRIAEDEFSYLREMLHNDELARQIAEASVRTAVSLLLSRSHIVAIMLWRQRTGDDLKTAISAVDDISNAIKRGEEITPA